MTAGQPGLVNMDKIIREYQIYANRRGFRYFMHKDEKGKMTGLKEAALVYSFDTFIHSFLAVLKGQSYLEPHVALGRSDLLINIKGSEFVIETKIFYDSVQFEEGKTQLAYYIKRLNLTEGIYLVLQKVRLPTQSYKKPTKLLMAYISPRIWCAMM